VFPIGYVVKAWRIADRRIILAGYRLAHLLTRVVGSSKHGFTPRSLVLIVLIIGHFAL
jgi:hypothetical protein